MWNLVTLDGFFEGPTPWDLAFHESVWGDELEHLSVEQLRSADALVFGRRTYEGMAAHWQSQTGEIADLMNAMTKIVFSKTLSRAEWNNTRLVRDTAEMPRVKQAATKDLFVFGSAELSSAFTARRLIDEYRLCIAPVVLGAGTPLFKPSAAAVNLALIDTRPLQTGGVILRYRPTSRAA
jgi:dihydrofolate reductase